MQDYFSNFHPIVNFTYFFCVIGVSMFFLHPIYMGVALSAAFFYSILLSGKKAVKFNLLYMVPTLCLVACINPMFNHEGATILFYLKNGNPFTLESVVYGVVSSTMLVTVILWFSCYNQVMSSDKVMYLFGKIIPALSLIFAMVLRFVPLYKQRIKMIIQGQKGMGEEIGAGRICSRIQDGCKILSIMVTWSLENAIETSDSMKARGYGLKGRTAFSNFVMTKRDIVVGAMLMVCMGIILLGSLLGNISVKYFPTIQFTGIQRQSMICYVAYFILCYIPIGINMMEEIKWKYFISRI